MSAPAPRRDEGGRERIRITYLIDGLGLGGTQTHLVSLLSGLDPARYACEVFYLVRGGWSERYLLDHGVPVTGFGITRIYGLAAARAFLRLTLAMRRRRPRVLHTYLSSSNVFGTLAGKLAGIRHVVATRRDNGFGDSRMMVGALRLTSRWTSRVVAVSHDAASIALRREGLDPARLTVIPNGIELDRFTPRGRRDEVRAALRVPLSAPLLACVAHLTPIKGIDVLIDAAATIRARVPAVVILVTGDRTRDRQGLADRVQQRGLGDSFRFIGHCEDVPGLLEAADGFVLPSRSEGQPNSVMEAMAMGLPVVATRVGGVPEVLEHGSDGLLVAPEDPEQLAEACVRILTSRELAASLGANARGRAARDFDRRIMVQRYQDLYEGLA